MVRVNLINPKALSDQHLIAEYYEILILADYARRYPNTDNIPDTFRLGKGHITFFKDKLLYLKKRHAQISEEMRNRGFDPRIEFSTLGYPSYLLNDWEPSDRDKDIVRERIAWKLEQKPDFYRYYGKHMNVEFLKEILAKM